MNPYNKLTVNGLLLTLSFIVCITLDSKAQVTADGTPITDSQLKWEHFTGPVDLSSKYAAMTYWYVSYKYNVVATRGDTILVDMRTVYSLKENSWVRSSQKTDELLNHEQGHFDFARLVALRFERKIRATTLLRSTYAKVIALTFDLILNEVKQMERLYDEETNHSLNRSEQQKWDRKIRDMLITK